MLRKCYGVISQNADIRRSAKQTKIDSVIYI
nr:MAG TPA: hypothetical protein [Caudoviricetes sp.]